MGESCGSGPLPRPATEVAKMKMNCKEVKHHSEKPDMPINAVGYNLNMILIPTINEHMLNVGILFEKAGPIITKEGHPQPVTIF